MKNIVMSDCDILFTREQAAEFLGCKATTLALWKSTKRYSLPCVKIGANVRYRLSDLKNFIKDNVKG